MAQRNLPRDFMAEFSGELFTHEGFESEETTFQRCPKTACELISEQKPEYSDRRLSTVSLPFTMYLGMEKVLEKRNEDTLRSLFVEVYGDRTHFLNNCMEEIEKAEIIVNQLRRTQVAPKVQENIFEEGEQDDDEVPASEEDKIKKLFDACLKDKSKVDLTKYMKIFEHGQSQVLAIAHAKLNKDFCKVFDKLKFKAQKRIIKPFTHPKGESMTQFNATSCKIYPLNEFEPDFKLFLLSLYNLEDKEDQAESQSEDQNDDNLAPSQDFPGHSQSRGGSTLKVCR